MRKVGIIGLGIMGNGMAENFLENGHEVFVWNRTKEKADQLVEKGAIFSNSPEELTQSAEVIFEITADDQSSKDVWLGDNGILAGADKDKVLVASGTLSIKWVDELAKISQDKGFKFLDIPVTGSRPGAESGNLVMLVGGDEKVLKNIQKDLESISSKVYYFGSVGSGVRFKLILNSLYAIHGAAFGEMLKIAEKAGLDIKKVGDALSEHPGGTTTNLAWKNFQQAPIPINFAMKWINKDINYAKEMAGSAETKILDEVIEKFKKAVEDGHGEEDWTNINKL